MSVRPSVIVCFLMSVCLSVVEVMPSVHDAGISGAEEVADVATTNTNHLFVTTPAAHDDDVTFGRQRGMPETHALSIVCGSVVQQQQQ